MVADPLKFYKDSKSIKPGNFVNIIVGWKYKNSAVYTQEYQVSHVNEILSRLL